MEKILTDFGVQPVYLAAQVVNFVILLVILKKFLYKPVLKVIEDRKKAIADGLDNSRKIEDQLQTTEQESAEKLAEASKQAKLILAHASNTANKIIADAHQKAQIDIDLMIEQGRKSISDERDLMKKQLQGELAGLVVTGIARVSGKVLEQSDHSKIVDHAIENLKQEIAAKE